MDYKNLRVGNIISFQGKAKTIWQIRKSGCDFHIGGNCFQSYIWESIKPLRLTEEWLLKFGFDKLPDGDFFTYLTGLDKTLEIIVGGDGFYPQIVQTPEFSNELQHTVFLNKIEAVHELQNLFFILSGNELE